MDEDRKERDRDLLARLAAGEVAALASVYDAYAPAVYRQALAVLGSSADAEDVAQDVFLKLVRTSRRPIRDLKTYLLTAARNESCSKLRRSRREVSVEAREEEMPGRATIDPHVSMVVRQALDDLPTEQREVVALKVFEGLTFEEIGSIVQASPNTVASRYRYALKKLRDILGEYTRA